MKKILFVVLFALLLLSIQTSTAKSVLFIRDWSDGASIDNYNWNGYSDLAAILTNNGYKVDEKRNPTITLNLLKKYDVVVFSPCWEDRVITDSEAKAFIDYVKQGGRLFLIGDIGVRNASKPQLHSLNKIGKSLGVQFKYVMVCDSEMHYYESKDPDEGVDLVVIIKENMVNHTITENVGSFLINWGCSLKVTYPFKDL